MAPIGILIVIGSVIGGYMLAHGNLSVLWQPAELVIIFGAALGSLIIASPGKVLGMVLKGFGGVFKDHKVGKAQYLDLLMLLYTIFYKIKKDGLISVESDVDNYEKSALFLKYPAILKDHHTCEFICDTIRTMVSANFPAHELENLMDIDLEANHHQAMIPPHCITTLGDSMPGLGIVAAVLGVVNTMGKISEPPEVLGHHIGGALVGTFLGILASYGFIGPMAGNLTRKAEEHAGYMNVVKTALIAGYSTDFMVQFAIEAGRRAIPGDDRPSFAEVETSIKQWKTKN